MASDRPNWINFDHYLAIHDATLRAFEHFIERDTIAIKSATSRGVSIRGRLHCATGVHLQLNILFERNEENLVRVAR